MSQKEKGWRELPEGALILNPGNTCEYATGEWRSFRPIKDSEKCTNCLICWILCPEGAIKVKDGKIEEIDLTYCKGCGICATECPQKAIEMVEEKKAKEAEQ